MYTCTICKEQNFTSPQIFYKHLIEHKSRHGCKKCDVIIIGKKERRRHYRQHTRITCQICNTDYEKRNKDEHTKSHEYLYSVDQLNNIVDIINQIQDSPPAKRRKTSNIEEYRGSQPNCPVKNCGEKFEDQNDLINHFINHRKNHLCQFCDEIFPDDETYESHIVNKTCHFYSCHNCGKEFSFHGFIRHISSECENKNRFDNMEIAEPVQTYNNRKIYRIYDEIQYSFTCFVCEEEFKTLELLNNHIKTHNKKLQICSKCFCVFNTEQELQDHETIGCENTEEIPVNIREALTKEIAEFLESLAKSRSHLVANKKVYEMLDDCVLFQCNICESKFVKFIYLKEHCAKHNHELIVCYKCLYLFNTWHEFRKHFCVELDYGSFSELEFREQFQKCVKRKWEEIIPKDRIPCGRDFNTFLNDDDDVRRMSVLINQLENTKFTNINVTKKNTNTPCTSEVNSNDDYDLNKILPRILERRNKRLIRKANLEEDCEEDLKIIGNNLHDLDICKKHLLVKNDEYDLDKVLPRIMKLRNKRYINEAIEDVDSFLEDSETEEPPNKRNKNEDSENTDYSVKNE